jgi:hypothetical protein
MSMYKDLSAYVESIRIIFEEYKLGRFNVVATILTQNVYSKYPLFSCIYTKIIIPSLSCSPLPQKTSTKIIQNIMMRLFYPALPLAIPSYIFSC